MPFGILNSFFFVKVFGKMLNIMIVFSQIIVMATTQNNFPLLTCTDCVHACVLALLTSKIILHGVVSNRTMKNGEHFWWKRTCEQ